MKVFNFTTEVTFQVVVNDDNLLRIWDDTEREKECHPEIFGSVENELIADLVLNLALTQNISVNFLPETEKFDPANFKDDAVEIVAVHFSKIPVIEEVAPEDRLLSEPEIFIANSMEELMEFFGAH